MQRVSSIYPAFDRKAVAWSPEDTGSIEIAVYIFAAKRTTYITTGISVQKKYWDKKTRRVSSGHPSAAALNGKLWDVMIAGLEKFELQCMERGMPMTISDLRSYMDNKSFSEEFTAFMADHAGKRSSITDSTRNSYLQTVDVMRRYKSAWLMGDMKPKTISDFHEWMISQGVSVGTAWKHHKNIKTHIAHAQRLDHWPATHKSPYQNFKVPTQARELVVLTHAEQDAIEALDLSDDTTLEYVRDLFMFGCYTGLRFSDMWFRYQDLDFTDDGIILRLHMKKVPRPVVLPLKKLFAGKPEEILRRYIQYSQGPDDTFFSKISNQYYNTLLKEIQRRAGVNTKLHAHMSRHVFGTRLAEKNIGEAAIMSLMGISNSDTVRIYIKLSGSDVGGMLDNIKW